MSENDTVEKQNYLREAIIQSGYDNEQFEALLKEKKGIIFLTNIENGDNLQNWTLDELKDVVNEFKEKLITVKNSEEEKEPIINSEDTKEPSETQQDQKILSMIFGEEIAETTSIIEERKSKVSTIAQSEAQSHVDDPNAPLIIDLNVLLILK